MILITGSAGYIGSHLCKYFKKKKIKYIGIDNLEYSNYFNIFDKKKFFKVCISDTEKLSKIFNKFKIETIIHTAAFSYVLDAENNKAKYKLNNIDKTKIFIDFIINNKVKNIVFLSSSNVYTENSKNTNIKETGKIVPKNYYGNTDYPFSRFE